MKKISSIIFFIVSIVFSTIYTPQAILPTLKSVFKISILETNLLLSSILFVLMIFTPMYIVLSKHFDKKNIMLGSIFFLFLSFVLSASAPNFEILLLSRILQGIFIPGITVIMLFYVYELYPPTHIGFGMGIYMAATGFGAVFGRLLAGWVTTIYSYKVTFAVFAGMLLVVLFIISIGIPSSKPKKVLESNKKESLLYYFSNFQISSVLFLSAIIFFSFMAITSFVTYYLSSPPFNFNSQYTSNIFLVLFLGIITSLISGKLSDKIGSLKILFFGSIILILGILLTLIKSPILIIAGIGIVTIGMFSVQSVTLAYLGKLMPNKKNELGVIYQTIFYLGGSLGTFIPAIAWKYHQYYGVAILCLVVTSLAIIGLFYTSLHSSSSSKK